jgi:hypothetical protein
MKEPEYEEGPEALERFKRGMKALFNAPKVAIVPQKKKAKKPSASLRKPKKSDKD